AHWKGLLHKIKRETQPDKKNAPDNAAGSGSVHLIEMASEITRHAKKTQRAERSPAQAARCGRAQVILAPER
ncbi:hypothetical protein, partial [Brucella ceti]|uniref:hypothetical protein n=1 Tax=Brucella ceti TaxID=120577 RepID=UPI001AEC3F31